MLVLVVVVVVTDEVLPHPFRENRQKAERIIAIEAENLLLRFIIAPLYYGGRYWVRTSDPYDVNVVL